MADQVLCKMRCCEGAAFSSFILIKAGGDVADNCGLFLAPLPWPQNQVSLCAVAVSLAPESGPDCLEPSVFPFPLANHC